MSDLELLEALRAKGEQRARILWSEAEEEVRRLHEEMDARLRKARDEINRHLERSEDGKIAARLQQAREEARQISMEAERSLARRCYVLAGEMLKALGDRDRERLLQHLAEEIPEASWETVTVNPKDREAAEQLFQKVDIKTDSSISGGFEIAAADRQIVINNTLEMRLQRAWTILLPDLVRDIREKLHVHEPADNQNA